MAPPESIAALIPVKSFAAGKTRLRGALEDDQRMELAARLAEAVIGACADLSPHVVCEDDEVAAWARSHGASVLTPPESGLNRVVRYGVVSLAAAGFDRVMVAHADIADPAGLAELADLDGVVLVPDLAMDGTNVVVIPASAGFRFSYGPNSFARHLSEAERLGLPIRVVTDSGLGLDLDDPEDLDIYSASNPTMSRS